MFKPNLKIKAPISLELLSVVAVISFAKMAFLVFVIISGNPIAGQNSFSH